MPKEIPSCELCGRNPSINNCEIEGTMMKVCAECSKFGKIKGKSNVKIVFQENKKPQSNEPEYVFVANYGSLVKNAREKMNLKQEDFAKSINEHKSLIHQVESENIKPNILLAKKLERVLRIKIVEELKNNESNSEKDFNNRNDNNYPNSRKPDKSKSEGLTLGDLINIKNKK
ncbi:MAG: helix-turn-helix domain-containing protein [Candidatus Woesearchaeota archaeon]